MKIILILLSIALTNCASTTEIMKKSYKDGNITEVVSEFDNKKEIRVEVAYLRDLAIKIGARTTSKMKKSNVVLTVEIPGAHNITDKNSLLISVDGKITKHSPFDRSTDIYPGSKSYVGGYSSVAGNHSSRSYMIKKKFLKKMIDAKKTMFKIVLLNGTYIEDVLSKPKQPMHGLKTASESLPEFYKRISQ